MLYNPANPAATGGHGSKPGSHREEPAWGCSVDPVATAVNVRVEMRQQQLLALAKATKPVCTVLVAAAVLYLRNAQVCAFVAGASATSSALLWVPKPLSIALFYVRCATSPACRHGVAHTLVIGGGALRTLPSQARSSTRLRARLKRRASVSNAHRGLSSTTPACLRRTHSLWRSLARALPPLLVLMRAATLHAATCVHAMPCIAVCAPSVLDMVCCPRP